MANPYIQAEYNERMWRYTYWLEWANKWLKTAKRYAELGLPELAEAAKHTSRRNRVYAAEAYNSALRLR